MIEAYASAETVSGGLDTLEKPSAAPRRVSVARAREEDDSYPAVIAMLNDKWRVIDCRDGMQWILQVQRGQRDGSPTWRSRRFHVERDALIRSCRECKARGGLFTVGELCEAGLRALEAAPKRHP